jgi:hypothetical protein
MKRLLSLFVVGLLLVLVGCDKNPTASIDSQTLTLAEMISSVKNPPKGASYIIVKGKVSFPNGTVFESYDAPKAFPLTKEFSTQNQREAGEFFTTTYCGNLDPIDSMDLSPSTTIVITHNNVAFAHSCTHWRHHVVLSAVLSGNSYATLSFQVGTIDACGGNLVVTTPMGRANVTQNQIGIDGPWSGYYNHSFTCDGDADQINIYLSNSHPYFFINVNGSVVHEADY